MQAKKSVFRPIALAVSALISTGAFAQTTVTTSRGSQPLGTYNLEVYDTVGNNVELTADRFRMSSGNFTNPNVTEVTALGISTDSLSASSGGTLAVRGIVDFSQATVQGLTGSFNPSEVTSALIGGTMSGGSTTSAPMFQSSGYSVDLSTGAATLGETTLGATTATTLSTSGLATLDSAAITRNATVGGTLEVRGATTTRGITNTGDMTNTGDIATATLSTSGLATLNSAAIINNATVGGTLAVTGATTLNGATTVNNTLNVNGATTVVGATSITGATTVVGTTNINTTGTAATSIGNSAAPVAVTGSTASFTGGTTNLTLNNNGATFSNAGSPAKVTGIANGTGDFDAVNVRQFSSAVAGVAAAANIPGVDTNKTASVGVGMGSYMNSQALAFGGSYRFSDNGVLRASLATGLNTGGSKTSFGIGAGWSW